MKKRILLEALITEREGMLAENTHRLNCGLSIAYGGDAFQKLADEIRGLASQQDISSDTKIRMNCAFLDEACVDCDALCPAAGGGKQ